MGNAFEDVTFDVNYRARIELARQARPLASGQFVFASSCSVYGSAEDGPRTEQSETGPADRLCEVEGARREEGLRELAGDGFASRACGLRPRAG